MIHILDLIVKVAPLFCRIFFFKGCFDLLTEGVPFC